MRRIFRKHRWWKEAAYRRTKPFGFAQALPPIVGGGPDYGDDPEYKRQQEENRKHDRQC